jgi:hypothetical protein
VFTFIEPVKIGFDLLGYLESHEWQTTAIVCLAFFVGGLIIKGIPWYFRKKAEIMAEWEHRKRLPQKLDRLVELIIEHDAMMQSVVDQLHECPVPKCPGLAFLRDEINAMERELMGKIQETIDAQHHVDTEIRGALYKLLDFFMATYKRNHKSNGGGS